MWNECEQGVREHGLDLSKAREGIHMSVGRQAF